MLIQTLVLLLQILWCDLNSEYDIVGPYFTSSSTANAMFVMSCAFEAIRLFQFYRSIGMQATFQPLKLVMVLMELTQLMNSSRINRCHALGIINPFKPTRYVQYSCYVSHIHILRRKSRT